MNNHLNLFKTYSTIDREAHKLENDLTRALALTLLENNVFLHRFLKKILNTKAGEYKRIFNQISQEKKFNIDIQQRVSQLSEVDHLFAVGISLSKIRDFFDQESEQEKEPITDMMIKIENSAIIIEIKPDNQDCTAQLYNQAYNVFKDQPNQERVTPVDYNWNELMSDAIQVNNFQALTGTPCRFLDNFIQFIRQHNYTFLPEKPLDELRLINENLSPINDRLETIIQQSSLVSLENKDRLGFECQQPWADEVLLRLNLDKKEIKFCIFPGNTKGQGYHIFNNQDEPEFKNDVKINGEKHPIDKHYHVKFTSFQKYFTELTFTERELKNNFYNRKNFLTYSGRKKKTDGAWKELEKLFNESFTNDFDWKMFCDWNDKIINSGKTQFDISFGYALMVNIPFKKFSQLDSNKDDLTQATRFLEQVSEQLDNIIVK